MRKKITIIAVLLILVGGLSSFVGTLYSSAPPEGYTGANGSYCTSCHQGNSLNTAGGMVEIIGLPEDGYKPGTTYNFSIKITHSAADRKRWGFSVAARNTQNLNIGSFSTTNTSADNNGSELSHSPAVITTSQNSYTYDNLSWTAPASPGANDNSIKFYFAGNAANNAGGNSGDFIYAGTKTIALSQVQEYTFTGNGNWNNPANWSNGTIPPATITAGAIIIDPPADGECVLNIAQNIGASVNITVKEGKKFRIQGSLTINK